MLALPGRGSCRAWTALAAALCFSAWFDTGAAAVPFHANALGSNSIKNPSAGGSSLSGGSGVMYDGSNKSRPGDSQKLVLCDADEDCNAEEFCSTPARGGISGGGGGGLVCLTCRKRRKRCFRDAMCCSGNFCNNGMCVEFDFFHPGRFEEIIIENFDHGTLDSHLKRTTTSSQMYHIKVVKRITADAKLATQLSESGFPIDFACQKVAKGDYMTPGCCDRHKYESLAKHLNFGSHDHMGAATVIGQEGAVCLRSSDCAEGLCCARHFWSKICKPVLKEGQVCTKHHKKGSHGLELFQRCYCGDGLTCRLQKDHTISNSSRLHTCQRH